MQDRLSELGFLTDPYDGLYGDITRAAVAAFQKANGLEETGEASPETLALLFSDSAKDALARDGAAPEGEPAATDAP